MFFKLIFKYTCNPVQIQTVITCFTGLVLSGLQPSLVHSKENIVLDEDHPSGKSLDSDLIVI